jgi:hypothetical protein
MLMNDPKNTLSSIQNINNTHDNQIIYILLGIINDNSHKEELIGNVSHAVESCILIGGQLAILWKYINSRKEIKKTWWESADRKEREIANSINDGRKKDVNNKRTSKPRSRKTSKSSKKIPK